MDREKPMLLRVSEAAALLSLGRSKTYELIEAGKLPSVRLDGALRVPRAAIERLATDAMRATDDSEGERARELRAAP
jgi:excisionase family DNA binding protein